MSANNFYFAQQIGNKWYGWDEMAETWQDEGKPVKLHLVNAVEAESLQELEDKLQAGGLGYAEYGITTQPFLPKDGTPIEIVV